MLFYARGSATDVIRENDLREALGDVFRSLGPREKVLAIPPDHTRLHSRAGQITRMAFEHYGNAMTDIMPALGTHVPMGEAELQLMFGDIPKERFRIHDWRNDVVDLGVVPADYIREISSGCVEFDYRAQVNRLLLEGGHDLILSIGQVVPHEVIGMANHNKNILVGVGGSEGIHKSHFLGAAYGMERIMGRADTPVRHVLDYADRQFLSNLPIVYILTVMGKDDAGELQMRGLFIGSGRECFEKASALALEVNFQMVEKPLQKVVVFLDPIEFRSTWLGNKAIYRTRMALADGGELLVLAPGVETFGEDPRIDALIRKYGYKGTPQALEDVRNNEDLRGNLSAAAHLIHGSSEGRFTITYATQHLSRETIESVGFQHMDLARALERFDPSRMKEGFNILPDGEEVFFVSNPALGLWAHPSRFNEN